LLIAIDYVGEGLPAKDTVVATGALQLLDRRQPLLNRITSELPVIGAQSAASARAAINCSEAGLPRSELLRGAVLDRIVSLKIPDDFLCGVLGDRCAISFVHLVYLGFPRRSG
jgi:hypothetical protein